MNRGKSQAHARRRDMRGVAVAGFEWESDYLYFTVREPFPTRTTGASLVFGRVTQRDAAYFGISNGGERGYLQRSASRRTLWNSIPNKGDHRGVAEKKGVFGGITQT